ncbi:hypothetical protein DPEC_G00073440 [Dallia pectoralis]|uniref:Uncharacterized protein n=1 Tax=Dallia pectoralis TaxID=75939 RepID=A0ACC2H3L3_DALPE|nr:hypothetical protein DPEC_G00073440 [Dallia pectoralis]
MSHSLEFCVSVCFGCISFQMAPAEPDRGWKFSHSLVQKRWEWTNRRHQRRCTGVSLVISNTSHGLGATHCSGAAASQRARAGPRSQRARAGHRGRLPSASSTRGGEDWGITALLEVEED